MTKNVAYLLVEEILHGLADELGAVIGDNPLFREYRTER